MRPPASTSARCVNIDGSRFLVARSASRARWAMYVGSVTTKTAPTRSLVIVAKAPSKSPGPRAPTGRSGNPHDLAAVLMLSRMSAWVGPAWFARTATRRTLGIASLSNSRSLPKISAATLYDTPVTFPPGRARLGMSPSPTGSVRLMPTMGIVPVALLAARAAGVGVATMTSTLSPTSAVASAGRPSSWPFARRNLDEDVRTSHPANIGESLRDRLCVRRAQGAGGREITKPVDFPGQLRAGGQRRDEEPPGQSADERPPPHYSIT